MNDFEKALNAQGYSMRDKAEQVVVARRPIDKSKFQRQQANLLADTAPSSDVKLLRTKRDAVKVEAEEQTLAKIERMLEKHLEYPVDYLPAHAEVDAR